MTLRACPTCGVLEERGMKDGRPWVNLNPITGHCVTCLAAMARDGEPPVEDPVFDARAEAARNDA
jgi:hypothetical protein